jgi:hypothetical protein
LVCEFHSSRYDHVINVINCDRSKIDIVNAITPYFLPVDAKKAKEMKRKLKVFQTGAKPDHIYNQDNLMKLMLDVDRRLKKMDNEPIGIQ